MKKVITFSVLCFVCLLIQGQETDVTVHINAGKLKDALTQEQMKTVRNLTITGSMNQEDLYQIHHNMPALICIDIENVELDTIPKEAFYANEPIKKITLPYGLKYIDNEAFRYSSIETIITGEFPKLGSRALEPGYIFVSEDNKYCKTVDGFIYSIDGKKLFYLNYGDLKLFIPEGTEIIAGRAFDQAYLTYTEFPSSLKIIEENAFSNAQELLPCEGDGGMGYFVFHSIEPPTLSKNVFMNIYSNNETLNPFSFMTLQVPPGKVNTYKNADPQWNKFKRIIDYNDYNPERGIKPNLKNTLHIRKERKKLIIQSSRNISYLEIVSSSGILLYSQAYNSSIVEAPIYKGCCCIRILYTDNSLDITKVIN